MSQEHFEYAATTTVATEPDRFAKLESNIAAIEERLTTLEKKVGEVCFGGNDLTKVILDLWEWVDKIQGDLNSIWETLPGEDYMK